MSNEWFDWQVRPDGVPEDGCNSETVMALKDYLQHNVPPKYAAQNMIAPIVGSNHPREEVMGLWSLLQNALLELPEQDLTKLMTLIQAIEDIPPTDQDTTKELTWRGLSNFGHNWSDNYRGEIKDIIKRNPQSERNDLRTTHIRCAFVEASFVKNGLAHIPLDWGFETIFNALDRKETCVVLDFEVPAVQQWFDVCGPLIWEAAQQRQKSWVFNTAVTSNDGVMDLVRWKCWKRRLEEIFERSDDPVVSDAARKALDSIEKAER